MTDSAVGSGDFLWVRFLDSTPEGPGIDIEFTDPPSASIGYCRSRVTFSMPGIEKYRIWTFKKQDNTLQLLCNGVEILNLKYIEISDKGCNNIWSRDFVKIIFPDNKDGIDTASDHYRNVATGEFHTISLIQFRTVLHEESCD